MADKLINGDMSAGCFGLLDMRNLYGRSSVVNPITLYSLTKIKSSAFGHLTWEFLRTRRVEWGMPKSPLYTNVLPGWTYVWNITNKIFSVTDNNGVIINYLDINTFCDLRISWDIITSNQFRIAYMDLTNSDIFLIGSLQQYDLESIMQSIGDMMNNSFLSEGEIHAVFGQLSSMTDFFINVTLVTEEQIPFDVVTTIIFKLVLLDAVSIILSRSINLTEDNLYPLDLLDLRLTGKGTDVIGTIGDEDGDGHSTLQGTCYEDLTLLMIALFSKCLLNLDSKVVIEPWMLWKTWFWYYNITRSNKNNRRIFDLSPRW